MCFDMHRAFLWHNVADACDAIQLLPATKAVCLECGKALIGWNVVWHSTNEPRGSPMSLGGSKELETANHFADYLKLPKRGFLARMFRVVE